MLVSLMTTTILDMEAVGALFGVPASTVARWRIRYKDSHPCPEPAGHVGRSPYWTDAQAWKTWEAARPGRGAGGGRPRKD